MGKIVCAAAMSHVLDPDYYQDACGLSGRRKVEACMAEIRKIGDNFLARRPDALIVVADDHHVSTLSGEQLDKTLLSVVHVLVLVGDDELISIAPLLKDRLLALEYSHCHWDEVVVGKGVLVDAESLELCVDRRYVLAVAVPGAVR